MENVLESKLDNIIDRLGKIEKQQELVQKVQPQPDQGTDRLDEVQSYLERLIENKFEQQKHFLQEQLGKTLNDWLVLGRIGSSKEQSENANKARNNLHPTQDLPISFLDTSNASSSMHASSSMQTLTKTTSKSQGTQTSSDDTLDRAKKDSKATGIPVSAKTETSFMLPLEVQAEMEQHDEFNPELTALESLRAQTRAEFVWFDNQMDEKLSVLSKEADTMTSLRKLGKEVTALADAVKTSHAELKEHLVKTYTETSHGAENRATAKIREYADALQDEMHKTKWDILVMIEKEAQLTRDQTYGYLPAYSKYSFDLYAERFRYLAGSGKKVVSLPWHINQFKSSIQGSLHFTYAGDMDVWLIYGRRPSEVGFRPRSFGKKMMVKATIMDTSGTLENLVIGEKTWELDEASITCNEECGVKVGEVLCDSLIVLGYGVNEGYKNEALLIRFDVKPM